MAFLFSDCLRFSFSSVSRLILYLALADETEESRAGVRGTLVTPPWRDVVTDDSLCYNSVFLNVRNFNFFIHRKAPLHFCLSM